MTVSVSALSDRWCERGGRGWQLRATRFQYPLCRIDGVNSLPPSRTNALRSFQYPLCRIDGVNFWSSGCATRHYSVSVSALSDRWCERVWTQVERFLILFQYPLCRIDGVNKLPMEAYAAAKPVSVSALSDRWCEPARAPPFRRRPGVSVSALSDRWCELGRGVAGCAQGDVSVSALSDRWCERFIKNQHRTL